MLAGARGALFAELREVEGATEEHLEADPEFTASRALFEVERRFGEHRDSRGDPVPNDGGIELLASAGELAEAEAVGGAIAGLLDDGEPAGEIAVVLRQPEGLGPLYRRVFARFGIPAAVQAELDVTRTLTGAGLDRAARGGRRARTRRGRARLPAHARARLAGPRRLVRAQDPPGPLERRRRGDRGLELRREPPRARRDRAAARGDGARACCARPPARRAGSPRAPRGRRGAVAPEDRSLELRAGAEIERGLLELADLGLEVDPARARRDRAGADRPAVARARPRAASA